jgi:hypothetical protein
MSPLGMPVIARRAKRENGGLGEDPPGSTMTYLSYSGAVLFLLSWSYTAGLASFGRLYAPYPFVSECDLEEGLKPLLHRWKAVKALFLFDSILPLRPCLPNILLTVWVRNED